MVDVDIRKDGHLVASFTAEMTFEWLEALRRYCREAGTVAGIFSRDTGAILGIVGGE